MSFFQDERQMYIPLTIDDIEVSKQSYFFSNKKVIEMVIAFFPYILFMYLMMQSSAKLIPMLVFSGIYALLFSYFFRIRILEENRLKKLINELDANRYSGIDYFWGINKISDDGLIHYEKDSEKNVRGYVVFFDRGSTVGVSEGNYTQFRLSKQEFLRRLGTKEYSFEWYEIPKSKVLPQSLINYYNLMTELENEAHKKLLKLQIDINAWFINESDETYVDYILVKCQNIGGMLEFRSNLEKIVEATLGSNNYIVDAKILDKKGVEQFTADLLNINSVNSDTAFKGQDSVPFEQFGKVVRVVGMDGLEINIDELDEYDFEDNGGQSLEKVMEREIRIMESKIKALENRLENDIKNLRRKKKQGGIGEEDFNSKIEELNKKLEEDIQYIRDGKDIIEKERKLKEQQNKRELRKEKIAQEREEKLRLAREPKYVELDTDFIINTRQDIINDLQRKQEEEYNLNHKDDYLYEDDLSLEDIMNMVSDDELSDVNEPIFDEDDDTNDFEDLAHKFNSMETGKISYEEIEDINLEDLLAEDEDYNQDK